MIVVIWKASVMFWTGRSMLLAYNRFSYMINIVIYKAVYCWGTGRVPRIMYFFCDDDWPGSATVHVCYLCVVAFFFSIPSCSIISILSSKGLTIPKIFSFLWTSSLWLWLSYLEKCYLIGSYEPMALYTYEKQIVIFVSQILHVYASGFNIPCVELHG
jgi:hypothetical protein